MAILIIGIFILITVLIYSYICDLKASVFPRIGFVDNEIPMEKIELKKVDIITASSPLDNTDWTNGDNALVNGNDGGIYSNFH